MKKATYTIIVFFLFSFSSYSQNQTISFIAVNGKCLYKHSLNEFVLTSKDLELDSLEIITDNGQVICSNNINFSIKPSKGFECNLTIKHKRLGTVLLNDRFLVLEAVKPEIGLNRIGSTIKIKNNHIPIEELNNLIGFHAAVFSQQHIIYSIESMTMSIYSQKKKKKDFITNGKLSEKMIRQIKKLHQGDMIILRNIRVQSFTDFAQKNNPDQSFEIKPTVFFIE